MTALRRPEQQPPYELWLYLAAFHRARHGHRSCSGDQPFLRASPVTCACFCEVPTDWLQPVPLPLSSILVRTRYGEKNIETGRAGSPLPAARVSAANQCPTAVVRRAEDCPPYHPCQQLICRKFAAVCRPPLRILICHPPNAILHPRCVQLTAARVGTNPSRWC